MPKCSIQLWPSPCNERRVNAAPLSALDQNRDPAWTSSRRSSVHTATNATPNAATVPSFHTAFEQQLSETQGTTGQRPVSEEVTPNDANDRKPTFGLRDAYSRISAQTPREQQAVSTAPNRAPKDQSARAHDSQPTSRSESTETADSAGATSKSKEAPTQKNTPAPAPSPANSLDSVLLSIQIQQSLPVADRPNDTAVAAQSQTSPGIPDSVSIPAFAAGPSAILPITSPGGNLAIAMQISSGTNDVSPASAALQDPRQLSPAQTIALGGNHGWKDSKDEDEPQHEHQDSELLAAINPDSPAMTDSSSVKSGDTGSIGSTHKVDFESELQKAQSEPVRGAHVQITGADSQRVDIRLAERAGVLSVTVRAGDGALSKAIQDHSQELSTRLATEHFQTQLWIPDSAKSTATSDDHGRGANSQGGNPGEQQPQEQRGNRDQNSQPHWVEEFENKRTAFQKRIEYTWHQ